ncbi:hypothetical protein C7S13_8292 [Burkholderia cepacia]|nr:hypothetical protein [Burkholderia cepacia]
MLHARSTRTGSPAIVRAAGQWRGCRPRATERVRLPRHAGLDGRSGSRVPAAVVPVVPVGAAG